MSILFEGVELTSTREDRTMIASKIIQNLMCNRKG